jgi:hypothetical protein
VPRRIDPPRAMGRNQTDGTPTPQPPKLPILNWPIVLQKSFCSTGLKFCGPCARRSNNNVGATPPRAKLTGDSGNAFEAALICDLRSFRTLAENQPLCLLGLLQHYRHFSDLTGWSDDARSRGDTVALHDVARMERQQGRRAGLEGHMRNIVDEAGEIIAKATDDHTLIGGHHRLAVAASLGQKLFWKNTGEPVKLDPFFKGSSHRDTA